MPSIPLDQIGNNGYGLREDGTQKGSGWLGEIQTKDGKSVMTELSVGVNIDGKEVLIPSIVPTLSDKEIKYLQEYQAPNDVIIKKAVDHARKRMKQGLSPFAD